VQSNAVFAVPEMDRITYDMDNFAVGRFCAARRRFGVWAMQWLILTKGGRRIVWRRTENQSLENGKSFGAERRIVLRRKFCKS
jgi:hypothetical protein